MTTYVPAEGVHVGRPPCANCGAALRLHRTPAADERCCLTATAMALAARTRTLLCPTPAAATHDLLGAIAALSAAAQGHDQAATFTARGEVQRYLDHRPGTCLPLCTACNLLLETTA